MNMPKDLDKRDFLIILVILFLGFSCMYFYNSHKITVLGDKGDEDGYNRLAVNILNGHGFSLQLNPPFTPSCFRTPAYPVFLALIYKIFGVNNYEAVRLIQVFLMLSSALMAFIMAYIVFKNKIIAYLSLILCSFYKYPWVDSGIYGYLMTETLTIFLITSGIFCVILLYQRDRTYLYCLAGIFFALAMLTRPANLLFPIVVAVYLAFRKPLKENYKRIILFLLVIFTLVFPWTVRNYLRFNKFIILSIPFNGLYTFYGSITHNPEFIIYPDYDFRKCGVYIAPQDLELVKKETIGLFSSLYKDDETEIFVHDNELKKIGLKIIKRDYVSFIKGWGYRILGHWHFGDLANILNGITKTVTLGTILKIMIKAAVVLIIMVGIFSNFKNELFSLLLLFPIYNTLVYTLLTGRLRYVFPSYCFIFILFSAGIWKLFCRPGSSKRIIRTKKITS